LDRIDPEFYRRLQRLDASDETRLKATSDEAAKWVEELPDNGDNRFTALLNFTLTITLPHDATQP